jgi:hypothetical protein
MLGRNAVLTNSKKLNQASALTTFPLSGRLVEFLIVGQTRIPSDHLQARQPPRNTPGVSNLQTCAEMYWGFNVKMAAVFLQSEPKLEYVNKLCYNSATWSIIKIVVCFLLGNSPASWILYADVSVHSDCSIFIAYEDGTECSETSAYKIQTPGNYPEESIQHTKQGESLKSRIS